MSNGLFIEPLNPEQEYLGRVMEAERLAAASFAPHRRREYFAWRALVRRELGMVAIGYNAVGAPILPEHPEIHLAVSHGADRVAVCISNRPCALDIESLNRPFGRIAARFLSAQEQALGSDPRIPAVVWSAKETLYKLSGEQELDFLSDLRITALGPDWVEGRIKEGEPIRFSLRYLDDAVVVWSL